MLYFLLNNRFPDCYNDINIEYDLFLNTKLKLKLTKYKLKSNADYSYVISAINCILHHPYFKVFKSNYCYTQNREINSKCFYSYYQYTKLINNILWNSFITNNITEIINCYNTITKNKVLFRDRYLRYYPYQILEHLIYCINNNFSCEFYENNHFVQVINHSILDFHNVTLTRYISKLLKHTNLNTVFITVLMHDDPYEYNKQQKHFNNIYYIRNTINQELKNDKINDALRLQNAYLRGSISKILDKKEIKTFDYVVDDYYLQSFVFIDKNFNCVYVKLKYDDNFNVIKRVRYGDNKIDYEHIEESLKPELNMFNKRRITDYYYDVNFCNINLVCYVKK